MGVLEGLFEAH